MTRAAYQLAAYRLAGLQWDAERAIDRELAERAQAMRDAAAARLERQYAADCAAQRAREDAVDIAAPLDRDPRRTLIAVQRARAAAASPTRPAYPCAVCGYGAGHGHHPLCHEAHA